MSLRDMQTEAVAHHRPGGAAHKRHVFLWCTDGTVIETNTLSTGAHLKKTREGEEEIWMYKDKRVYYMQTCPPNCGHDWDW